MGGGCIAVHSFQFSCHSFLLWLLKAIFRIIALFYNIPVYILSPYISIVNRKQAHIYILLQRRSKKIAHIEKW
jgi:hypothetical protein